MTRYINPRALLEGSFIPDWLMQRTDISPGAKLCYARLAKYFNKDKGFAWPKIETMAGELGASRRQIDTYLKALKDAGLIEAKRKGLGQSNLYRFPDPDISVFLDTQYPAHLDTQDTAHPIEKNLLEESKEKDTPPPPKDPDGAQAFHYYNSKAVQHGWRKADTLTAMRAQKIRQRLNSVGGATGWRAALDLIPKSRFLMGKAEGRDGRRFKMHLDFLLQESSFTKLREGFYNDPEPTVSKFRPL